MIRGEESARNYGKRAEQEAQPAGNAARTAPANDGRRTAGSTAAEPGSDATPPFVGSERLEVDEPILAARVHRPADLVRVLLGVLGIALVLAIATFAIGTTRGLQTDIGDAAESAPSLIFRFAGTLSSIAVLVVPVAYAVSRLIRRDGLRIADGVLAAVLAHGVSLTFSLWVARLAPVEVRDALTTTAPGGGGTTDAVHGYLAPVIAYMTAVGMSHRPRWRVLMWAVLTLDAVSVLVAGFAAPFAIVVTILIGWTVAYATLYAVGSPNVRPTGQQLLAGLRHVGFSPVAALRAEDTHSERGVVNRRYLVTLQSGPPLDVTVVDREQQAHGYFYRVWRRLALRGIHQPRSLQTLREALQQEALMAYAAIAAGANVRKLIAASELGPDAVMLIYEHVAGRDLNTVPDDEITDELMEAAWRQVRAMQSRRIAHRRFTGESLLLGTDGTVYITDLRGGEIAAGDLLLRMDVAQLLVTFGLRVGAQRAVTAAVAEMGPDAVADALPLLQPIALSRRTRQTLRQLARERGQRERQVVLDASRAYREAGGSLPPGADRKAVRAAKHAEKQVMEDALAGAKEQDLLSEIRSEVLEVRPQAPVEPARLERIRPRTLVMVLAAVFAVYFLITQLVHLDFQEVLAQANWGWALAAAAFAVMTYFAAALSLLGFVPEKVPYGRTVLVQVAGAFVKLVAPAAIGGVALNTRYLQRSGIRAGHAVASVGANQLFGLGTAVTLLLAFAYITGSQHTPRLPSSPTVIAGMLTVAVLVLIITAVPTLRKFLSERITALFAGVVPRMLDVVQQPRKLLSGIGGMIMMTLAFVLCLDASVRAFGGELNFATIAVVFLAGNALGSAAPTPGGVGAVELTLATGLAAFGLHPSTAAAAVMLFRLFTFWLPVLPGWLAFTQLTRKEYL